MSTKLKILFSLLIIFCSTALHSQSQKAIALGNSSNPAGLSQGDVSMFEGAALTGIRQTSLCIALERKEWEKILKERGIQKTEEFLDGKIAQQGVSLGADFLLVLSIQSMASTDKTNLLGSRTVNSTVVIGANVISVETGQIKYNKNITLNKSHSWSKDDPMFNASREDAVNSFKTEFIQECEWEFSVFMYEVFPPEIVVLRTDGEGNEKKAKKVLCKTSARLPEGIKLDVYIEESMDLGDGESDITKTQVGKLKIDEVKSDKAIVCDVKSGGEKILEYLNSKTKMKCTVNFEGGFLDNLNPFKKKPKY